MPSACLTLSPIWFYPSAARREKPYLFRADPIFPIKEIRQSAWGSLPVIKSKNSINRFHVRIDEICDEARRIADNRTSVPVEVENLQILGKALAKTALERKENRGRFYREDYPVPAHGKPEVHILTLSEAGEVTLRKEVLDPQWNPDFENMLDKERWG